jgi:hypothetical protein
VFRECVRENMYRDRVRAFVKLQREYTGASIHETESIIDPEFYRDQTEVLFGKKRLQECKWSVSLFHSACESERLGVSAIHNKGGGHSFVVVTRVPTAL